MTCSQNCNAMSDAPVMGSVCVVCQVHSSFGGVRAIPVIFNISQGRKNQILVILSKILFSIFIVMLTFQNFFFFGCSWSHRLRPKKLHASVAVPAASVRVPSRRPLALSVASYFIIIFSCYVHRIYVYIWV